MLGTVPSWLLLAALAGFAGTQENLSIPLQHPFVLVLGSFLIVRMLFEEKNLDWTDLIVWVVATVLTLSVVAPFLETIIGLLTASTFTHFAQPAVSVIVLFIVVEVGYAIVTAMTGEAAPESRTKRTASHA